jgi:DNA-binding transcriptional LysR family regulator
VHVAAFPSAERALLAPAVAALAGRHPDVKVRTTELEPELSLPALRLGDADLAIAHEDTGSPAPHDARLERVDLLEEPLRVVLPAGHPADADAVALERLAGERWVATPPGTACRAMVDRACGVAGYVPEVPFQANEFSVLAAFVAAGLGVALIPEIALGAFGDGTVVRAVADVPVARRIYVAARRGGLERPALAAMVAALSDAAGATARRPSMRG